MMEWELPLTTRQAQSRIGGWLLRAAQAALLQTLTMALSMSVHGGGQGRQALEDVQLIKWRTLQLCSPYKTFTAHDGSLLNKAAGNIDALV
jgi:hypothetical protein